MLNLFKDYKLESFKLKDCHGDTPLFYAAKAGDSEIFKWFSGHVDFFRARGE